MSKIIGVTVGTPINPKKVVEKTELGKQVEKNTKDIGTLSEQKVDKQDGYSMVSDSEKQAWNNKSDFSGSYNDLTDKPEIPEGADLTGYATEDYVKDYAQPKGNYLTEHQDLSGYALKEEIPTVPEKLPNPNPLTFTGAVTGSYDGSEAVNIDIPISSGGSGGNLVVGLTPRNMPGSFVADKTFTEICEAFEQGKTIVLYATAQTGYMQLNRLIPDDKVSFIQFDANDTYIEFIQYVIDAQDNLTTSRKTINIS